MNMHTDQKYLSEIFMMSDEITDVAGAVLFHEEDVFWKFHRIFGGSGMRMGMAIAMSKLR